jgi:hypothetical protein
MWTSALQKYDGETCRPVNFTATNTTCACKAGESDERRRYLTEEGLDDSGEGGADVEAGMSVTSGSDLMAESFAALFDPSALGAGMFLNNILLLVTFGAILIIALLNMLLGTFNDMRDRAAEWTAVEAAKARQAQGRERELALARHSAAVEQVSDLAVGVTRQTLTSRCRYSQLTITPLPHTGDVARLFPTTHHDPHACSPRRSSSRSRASARSPTTRSGRCLSLWATVRSVTRSAASSLTTMAGSRRRRSVSSTRSCRATSARRFLRLACSGCSAPRRCSRPLR